MATKAEEHGWAQHTQAKFASGLLDDADADRFTAHLLDCSVCRVELNLSGQGQPSAEFHIPDEILGRWSSKRDALEGLQRELVRRHLEQCEECRSILRFTGYDPVLEQVARLEPNATLMRMLEPALPETVAPTRSVDGKRRTPWRAWLQGGAFGGGLVAAAAALLIITNQPPHPEVVRRPQGQLARPPAARLPTGFPMSQAPTLAATLVRPHQLTEPTRSEGQPREQVIKVSEDERVVAITAEVVLDLDPGARVRVQAIAPDGTIILDETHAAQGFSGRPVLSIKSTGPFPLGRYQIRFSSGSGDRREHIEYSFRIRRN